MDGIKFHCLVLLALLQPGFLTVALRGETAAPMENLKVLERKLGAATAVEKQELLREYIVLLGKALKEADAKQRPLEYATKHLLDYASIQDAAAILAHEKLSSDQAAMYRVPLGELKDRVKRWSVPERYYREKMSEAKKKWNQSQFDDAAELLRAARAVARAKDRPNVLFLEGIARLTASQLAQGRSLLETMLRIAPDSPRAPSAHYVLGHLLWVTLDYKRAAGHFEYLAKHYPGTFRGREGARLFEALSGVGDPKRWK